MINPQLAKARVLKGEQFVDVLTKDVLVGEVIEVCPGELIPLNSVVLNGNASVDEESFTGQSTPALNEVGSSVVAP